MLAIFRNVARRPVRTMLTALGIALSTAVTVSLLSISYGMESQASRFVASGGNELTVVQSNPNQITFGYLGSMPLDVVDRLRRMAGVAWARPVLIVPSMINNSYQVIVYGIDANADDSPGSIVRGRGLTNSASVDAVLGKRVADAIRVKTGDLIWLHGVPCMVVGISASGNVMEDSAAFITLRNAQQLFDRPDTVSLVKVKLSDPRFVDRMQQTIARNIHGVSAIPSASLVRDRLNLEAATQVSWSLSIVALALSTIAVAESMIMAVIVRTREIGILRAMGWSNWNVIQLFLGEAITLSCLGGILGCLIGLAGIVALSRHFPLLPMADGVPPFVLAGCLALSVTVGILGGIGPAIYAARLDPIRALRHE